RCERRFPCRRRLSAVRDLRCLYQTRRLSSGGGLDPDRSSTQRRPRLWFTRSVAEVVAAQPLTAQSQPPEQTVAARVSRPVVKAETERMVTPRAYWKGFLKLSLVSCPI